MLDVAGVTHGVIFGHGWRDDAGKYPADVIKENLVVFLPVKGLDHGTTQGTIATVLLRVGMVTNPLVGHVEIGIDKTGFGRCFELIRVGKLRFKG